MWKWLTGRTPAEDVSGSDDAPKRRGIFTTALGATDSATLGELLGDKLHELQSQRPIPRMPGAQDAADDYPDAAIKGGYFAGATEVGPAVTGFFLGQSFIGHQLAGMLAQHWLIDKCCLQPARDAVRQGYEITSMDGEQVATPEVLRMLNRMDKQFKIKAQMREYVHWGKVFGIRIAIFKVKSTDPNYYEYPFNPDSVTPGSYKGIVQVDPYWCTPELSMRDAASPDSEHFYEPTWWFINGKRYHRSHLMIYREGEVADVLKPSYQYGGIPLPQKIMERVYAAERTANEAPQLAMTKRTQVIKTDLENVVVGGPDMLEQFDRMSQMQDNYQKVVVDREDEVAQFDTALADLDVTIMTQFQLVASTACVPGTKLMGTQPKGFNATGEFDEAMYHEELESLQTDKLTAFIERHHMLCMLSFVTPAMRKSEPDFEPFETTVSWAPLDSPTGKEYAEISLIEAQTDVALQGTGAIDAYDIRNRLLGNKNSGYAGLEVIERPDDDGDGKPDAPVLAAPVAAQPQGFGFDDQDVQLITNQTFLDPEIVKQKQEAKDYTVQVTQPLPDPDTQRLYRIVIDGHHSLEAARIDGVAPDFQEASYGSSDYFNAMNGEPLAQ